jgi:exosortase
MKRIIKWHKLRKLSFQVLKECNKNHHNRVITCGVLVGLYYLPQWLNAQLHATLSGSSSPMLNWGFLFLGVQALWQQRHQLATLNRSVDERLGGYFLILGGTIAFPFCLDKISLQAFVCALIVVGIFWSCWGLEALTKQKFPVLLILFSIYPDLLFISNQTWRVLTPHNLLENNMAWIGSLALNAIGQPDAVAIGSIVKLPAGAVEVASGCSGFDMAFVLAGTGLLLGLFLKETKIKIIGLIFAGILLALVLNVPRIVLLTFASVYWGKDSFEFWHGPIGGQIFASVLLTIYYYLAMWLVSPHGKGSKAKG